MIRILLFFLSVIVLSAAVEAPAPKSVTNDPVISKIKDYAAFEKFWKAHPDQRVALFVRYPDWSYRWLTEVPGNLSQEWHQNPKGLCDFIHARPLLLTIWLQDDKGTALQWMESEDCRTCLKDHPLLLSKFDDSMTNDLLYRFPDIFLVYFKADPILAKAWASRNIETFKELYDGNESVHLFVESNPELRALVVPNDE